MHLAILLSVGSLPLTWFKEGVLFNYYDFDFTIPPFYGIERYFYLWDDFSSPGWSTGRLLPQIIYRLMTFWLGSHFSVLIAEKILFVFLFVIGGFCMYYLSYILVSREERLIAPLASALFYMLNPFTMNLFWHNLRLLPLFTYGLFPLVLGFYIKGLQKRSYRYAFLISLVSVLMSTSGLIFIAAPLFILFLYSIFSFFQNKNEKYIIYQLKFMAITAILCLCLNFWWLLPQLYFLGDDIQYSEEMQKIIGLSNFKAMTQNSWRSSFLNVFRLGGLWNFFKEYRGEPYFNYAYRYSTGVFQIVSFLLPLFAFTALMAKKKNKFAIFFSLLAIIGLFLLKGIHEPFSQFYAICFKKLTFMRAFRNFYDKFGIIVVLGYAFLIGLSLARMFNFLHKKSKNTLVKLSSVPVVFLIISCIVVVYVFPMWSGGVFPNNALMVVPSYYQDADRWLTEQKGWFRVFPVPVSKLFMAKYRWKHGYFGQNPLAWLFSKPTITFFTVNCKIPALVASELCSNLDETTKLLELLNVKYILLHKDADWKFINGHPWWFRLKENSFNYLKNYFNSCDKIRIDRKFGELFFYKVDSYRPLIYATTDSIVTNASLFDLVPLLTYKDFNKSTWLIDTSELLPVLTVMDSGSQANAPDLEFKRLSPVKYRVTVKKAISPFLLVFSENYHPMWQVKIKGQVIDNHFRANWYANAWYIDKRGTYDIIIEFWPQKLFYIGLVVSLTSFILCLFFGKKKPKSKEVCRGT